MRADRDRWREEIKLLEEELRRTVRGFRRMSEVWTEIASENSDGRRAYAYRQADMYYEMARDANTRFLIAEGTWGSNETAHIFTDG